MKSNQLPVMASFILKKLPLVFLILSINLITSCGKDDDDDPKVTNADISGDYSGTVTIKSEVPNAGSNEDTFTDAELTITGSGTDFKVDAGDGISSDVKVTGNSFKSTTGNGVFNKGLTGNVSGDNITFSFSGQSADTLWSGTYTGAKISSGGSGNGGGGNGGSKDITVNGNSYSFTQSICDLTTGFSMGALYSSSTSIASVTLNFESSPTAGNYTVVFPGPPVAGEVVATISYDISENANSSGGNISVTENGGVYTATLDNITFDLDLLGDPRSQVNVKGVVTCE